MTASARDLVQSISEGRIIDFATPDGGRTPVRADVIRVALTQPHLNVDPRGFRISNATILGALDISGVDLSFPVEFDNCEFQLEVDLSRAHLPKFSIPRCEIGSIDASSVSIDKSFDASEIRCSGTFNAQFAEIGAQLVLSEAQISNPAGYSLILDGARIKGDLVANESRYIGLTAFSRATIEGLCVLENSMFHCDRDYALVLSDSTFVSGIVGVQAQVLGGVLASNVTIKSTCNFSRALMFAGTSGDALYLDGAELADGIMAPGLCAVGRICALSAKVDGQFNLVGARLLSTDQPALVLDRVTISSGLVLDEMFCVGALQVPGAHIGGQALLSGCVVVAPYQDAVNLTGAAIDGGLNLTRSRIYGTVRAPRARINDRIVLDGAQVQMGIDWALDINDAVVGGDIAARYGRLLGGLRATSARIGSQLNLQSTMLTNTGGRSLAIEFAELGSLSMIASIADGYVAIQGAHVRGQIHFGADGMPPSELEAISLEDARVDSAVSASGLRTRVFYASGSQFRRSLDLSRLSLPKSDRMEIDLTRSEIDSVALPEQLGAQTVINLSSCRIRVLRTQSPQPSVRLSGRELSIGGIDGPAGTAPDAAIAWLNRWELFDHHPWTAVADVYERTGRTDEARRLRYLAAAQANTLRRSRSRSMGAIYRWVAGFGYYPWRAALWVVLIFLLSTAITHMHKNEFVPTRAASTSTELASTPAPNTSPDAPTAIAQPPITGTTPCASIRRYPCFHSAEYVASGILPGGSPVQTNWVYAGQSMWVLVGLPTLRVLAWILVGILAAGVTGLLRKR